MAEAPAAKAAAFRAHLPDLSLARFQRMQTQDAHQYAEHFFCQRDPPWLYDLVQTWLAMVKEPFKGVTNDGHVKSGLFRRRDEGLAIETIVTAVQSVLGQASQEQREKLLFALDAEEWRRWSNPEMIISSRGLRLDELDAPLRDAILRVLQATLSAEGYAKAVSAMRINHFLGQLVESPAVMNESSYNFLVFGSPSTSLPWGWSLYGHHLCLNVFFYQRQIVISPFFTGAEPNVIDQGPYQGTSILSTEETLGLELMRSLAPEKQAKAQIYKLMHDPAMPPGRWNKDDQRHLCGAYRDNRVVPYEGILVSEMTGPQQDLVLGIMEQFHLYLPEQSRQMKLADVQSCYAETYFSWIGGFDLDDPFYYRIQSPITLLEFDHHSGVFLSNAEPAKFHIHTILRTPNAGDYGYALRPLSTEASHSNDPSVAC